MDPYIGEIKIAAFGFAPDGWLLCQGQSLPVMQNQALYSLLNGYYTYPAPSSQPVNFNLPDLRGRTPTGWDQTGRASGMLGTQAGVETVSLTGTNLPLHQHTLYAAKTNGTFAPMIKMPVLAEPILASAPYSLYASATPTPPLVAMNPGTCTPAGSGAPHDNMQPSLVLNFMIATQGIYPQRP